MCSSSNQGSVGRGCIGIQGGGQRAKEKNIKPNLVAVAQISYPPPQLDNQCRAPLINPRTLLAEKRHTHTLHGAPSTGLSQSSHQAKDLKDAKNKIGLITKVLKVNIMGVKELWPSVEPVMEVKSFDDLSGQTIAVDLSMWIVDSQCVKQMAGAVVKPHLRNLFFRTSAMLHADILPVFVVEGNAPELKWQTMVDRQYTRTGKHPSQPSRAIPKRACRKNFNSIIKECVEMLDYLGVPHLQATGEAEALCADLNKAGLVDGVITADGDAFLYGARTVYKNFTTTKTPSVESYAMDDIERQTGLYREHLIALALLVGCDYCPKGVPGVGIVQALKLCQQIPRHQILNKLIRWSSRGISGLEEASEKTIAQKIFRMDSKNFNKVIQEFVNEASRLPSSVGVWKKPLISRAQMYNLEKLEWPVNYSLEKMLPLLTLWCMKALRNGVATSDPHRLGLEPERIVKKRMRQGVQCLEVLWRLSDPYEVDEEDEKRPSFTTIEPIDGLSECYPDIVEQFLRSKTEKPKKTTTRKKVQPKPIQKVPPTEVDSSKEAVIMVNLQHSFTQLTTQNSKIFNNSADVPINTHSDNLEGSIKMKESLSPVLPDRAILLNDSVVSLTDSSVSSDTMNKDVLCERRHSGGMSPSDLPICVSSCIAKPSNVASLTDNRVCQSDGNSLLSGNWSTDSSLPTYDLNGSRCCSPLLELSAPPNRSDDYFSPKLVKAHPRTSLDALLDDIALDLDSPVRTYNHRRTSYTSYLDCQQNFIVDSPRCDSIITGHVTPSVDHYQNSTVYTNKSRQLMNSTCLPEANSTISLLDVKSENNSDISLFDVNSGITTDQTRISLGANSNCSIHSVRNSPLPNSFERNAACTLANFDIIPNISDWSLTDL